ncbi:MAG: hypothetical protein EON98_16515, partial [Chitinophagaceae bacterium]
MRKLVVLISFFVASTQLVHSQGSAQNEISGLIKRILPQHASFFQTSFIPKDNGQDVFEIESKAGKIILRGNNGVSIASALHHYLKNFTKNHISWNGSNLKLPATLPVVKKKIRVVSPHQYRYYLNYCTGMKTILPAFTGHVPPSFAQKFPKAKLKKTAWQGFSDVFILDPDDSLFTVIGKSFTKQLIQTFGTDHLYSADTFNENTPPTNDSTYLNDISKKVYQSMASVDPKAVWIMQGWMFSYTPKYWQPTQIKALLNAVPNDKMIILDLYSESKPMWNKTEAYYGKPWIWCMLHNFGGNISLYGRMNNVANDPVQAKNDPASGKMSGIGLTPEAIEQNPVMYELM